MLKHTPKIDLPFFAYGLFRPGQLAFFQIRDLIEKVAGPSEVAGTLLLRDGLPIIDPQAHGKVKGCVLTFTTGRAATAYDRISALEPEKHYCWHEVLAGDTKANVLVGRSPGKGSVDCEDQEWNGWNDPLFTAALSVVDETLATSSFEWDLKPLFRLQMAYLLLWSSIERYVSLRYHLGDKATAKVNQLASEPAFAIGLSQYVTESRELYRADDPDKKVRLDPQDPKKSLTYYYQVRSNLTHRGKGVGRDHDLLEKSLKELLAIFRGVLEAAKHDAGESVY